MAIIVMTTNHSTILKLTHLVQK